MIEIPFNEWENQILHSIIFIWFLIDCYELLKLKFQRHANIQAKNLTATLQSQSETLTDHNDLDIQRNRKPWWKFW